MSKPPKFFELDSNIRDQFTLNGFVPAQDYYIDNSQPDANDAEYISERFAEYRKMAQENWCLYYTETDAWLREALQEFPITGKDILIVGSTCPWYEAIAIEAGCNTVTVVDYRPQQANLENVLYITPDKLTTQKFDIIWSISSYEHDGLGRYGDPINPNGDLKAMYEIAKNLQDDGLLFLVVPVGKDAIVWNAHRVYGRERLPRLLFGWNVVKTFGLTNELLQTDSDGLHNQPVFILKQGVCLFKP
jgi:SAM-dependent methyltransferase